MAEPRPPDPDRAPTPSSSDPSEEPERNPTRLLAIAQYSRGTARPPHHALFVLWSGTPATLRAARTSRDAHDHWGTAYHILGAPAAYHLACAHDECMEILADGFRGALHVGGVHERALGEAARVLAGVQVWQGREDWNGTNWVLGAVERMREKGWVGQDMTRDRVRAELDQIFREFPPEPAR